MKYSGRERWATWAGLVVLLAILSGCAPVSRGPARKVAREPGPLPAGLGEERVDEWLGPVRLGGYVVWPEGGGRRPGVLLLHPSADRPLVLVRAARRLAREGFVVFVLRRLAVRWGRDLPAAGEARDFASRLGRPEFARLCRFAVDWLTLHPGVDPSAVAVVGWDSGGEAAFRLAACDPRVTAMVIYSAPPIDDAHLLRCVRGPLLGIYGEDDRRFSSQAVLRFDRKLLALGVPAEMHLYPGCGEGFADPAGGRGYEARAAEDAWSRMVEFLRRVLRSPDGV